MENAIEIEESRGKNKGFTLIELLIVIVILGILAAVTVFAVRGITDKGTASVCSADQKTLETAIESYFAQSGATTIAVDTVAPPGDLPIPGVAGKFAGATPDQTLVNAGFLRAVSSKYTLTDATGNGLTPTAGGNCPVVP